MPSASLLLLFYPTYVTKLRTPYIVSDFSVVCIFMLASGFSQLSRLRRYREDVEIEQDAVSILVAQMHFDVSDSGGYAGKKTIGDSLSQRCLLALLKLARAWRLR